MKRALLAAFLAAGAVPACAGWSPSRPFERDAPPVRDALDALDAGDATAAVDHLEDYLSTGPCKDGNIGTPDLVRRRADGTFDLGLALFRVGEQYGRRFGEEEGAAGGPPNAPGPHGGGGDATEAMRAQRHAQIGCAHAVVQAIAIDPQMPAELRLRAEYLDGNLSFLDGEYEQAVHAYDQALTIGPGQVDGGDPVGRDAAWNRAIALERIDEKKDAGNDASPGGDSGGSGDGGQSRGDGGQGGGDNSPKPDQDAGGGGERDAGGDDGAPPQPEPDDTNKRPDAGPSASPNQDDRTLDQLENAPTLQQEAAKHTRHRRVVIDK